MAQITYEELFACLEQLGFQDQSTSEFKRVFEHTGLGILLAFAMLDDGNLGRPVRDADITTVNFQLQQRDLLKGDVRSVIERVKDR